MKDSKRLVYRHCPTGAIPILWKKINQWDCEAASQMMLKQSDSSDLPAGEAGIASALPGAPPRNDDAFTYIEMLVVITLVGLCFVPLLQMFAQSMDEVEQYSELGTAFQLGREGMESVKNLRFTEAQIEAQGVVWMPAEKEPPLVMNKKSWRVKRTPVRHTDPLEVHVEVFRVEDLNHPIVEFATLIEDL